MITPKLNLLTNVATVVNSVIRKTFCPNCLKIPFIQLLENQPDKIQLKCDCGYKKIIRISEYYTIMDFYSNTDPKCQKDPEHKTKKAKEFCKTCELWFCEECLQNHKKEFDSHITRSTIIKQSTNCEEHKDKSIEYFCKDCNRHICSLCKIENHSAHVLIELDSYLNNFKMKKIKEDMDTANKFIKEYYQEVKETFVNKLKQAIEDIEEAYETNQKLNHEIMMFVQLLIDNYNPKEGNYYIVTNILNNANFKFIKCDELEDKTYQISKEKVDCVIKYLNSNNVIKTPEKELEELKLTNTIHNKKNPSSVSSLLVLNDGRLAACFFGKIAKIYNIATFQCEGTLTGHIDSISYLSQMKDGKILTCSYKTIKIWDGITLKCISTITKHSDWIVKIIPLNEERIATCSWDKKIIIFKKSKPYSDIATLEGHTEKVTSILQLKNKNILVSGSTDKDSTLRIWNLTTYKNEKIINKIQCCYRNGLVEIKNERLCVGGNGRVSIVNMITYEIEKVICDESLGLILSFVLLGENNLLCGSEKGKIFYIDLVTFKGKVINDKAHKEHISSIVVFNERWLASGSWDKTIKVWNY